MIASTGKRILKKIAKCFVRRPAESCVHDLRAYSEQLDSQIVSSKTQFDINQTKFLALSDVLNAPTCERWESSPIGLALLGKKREFAPEANEYNEKISSPLQRELRSRGYLPTKEI